MPIRTYPNGATGGGGADISSHTSQADPHTQYQRTVQKDQVSGYPGLDSAGLIAPAHVGVGAGDSTKVLWGDGQFRPVGSTAPPATPPVDHFDFTLPGPTVSGVAFSFTITARNADGTVATGYLGTVRISSSDSPATDFPFSYTFVTGDAGVKSFSKTLVTVGGQTITVADLSAVVTSQSTAITITNPSSAWAPSSISGLFVDLVGDNQSGADGSVLVNPVNSVTSGGVFYSLDPTHRPTRALGICGTNHVSVLRFDGVNDETVHEQNADLHSGITMYFTGRLFALATEMHPITVFADASAYSQQFQFVVFADGTIQVLFNNYDGAYSFIGRRTNPASISANEDAIIGVYYDGGTTPGAVQIWKNGIQIDTYSDILGTFPAYTGAAAVGWRLGGQDHGASGITFPTAMGAARLTVYNRVLTTAEKTAYWTNIGAWSGIPIGSSAPPGPPPSGLSIPVQEDAGTMEGDRNGGSGWGKHFRRIHKRRTAPAGQIYFSHLYPNPAPMPAGDEVRYRDLGRVITRTGTNTWSQVAEYEGGYHNNHVFEDPDGYLCALGWPGGYQHIQSLQYNRPRFWSERNNTWIDIFNGLWHDHQFCQGGYSEWPYAGVGINRTTNKICILRVEISDTPMTPNQNPARYEVAWRGSDLVWHGPYLIEIAGADRYAYFHILPGSTAGATTGWHMYGTRDKQRNEADPTFGLDTQYVFDGVMRFDFPDDFITAPTMTNVRQENVLNNSLDIGNVCQVVDVLVDSSGNEHLTINQRGPGTNYNFQCGHQVWTATGTKLAENVVPIQWPNFTRMWEDASNVLTWISANQGINAPLVVNVVKATNALGTTTTSQVTLQTAAGFRPGSATFTQNIFVPSTLSGGSTVLSNTVPIFIAQDHIMGYIELQLA